MAKKSRILVAIMAGLGLSSPVRINKDITQPAPQLRLTPKQMKPHCEKINQAEYNRARKAKKRIRDHQRSLDNNPCMAQ